MADLRSIITSHENITMDLKEAKIRVHKRIEELEHELKVLRKPSIGSKN